MIGGFNVKTAILIPRRIFESEIRPAQADAIDFSMKRPLQRFANLIQGESDARRAAVNRQDARISLYHGQSLQRLSIPATPVQRAWIRNLYEEYFESPNVPPVGRT